MKRFYLFCLLVLISIPMQAKNKISMVTYFPVPYVAYSQVNTTEQMDIGLTSTCNMKLGCSETSATLNAARVNLNGGKLNLDGGRGIKGYTLSLGNGSGEGRISFQNVRIQTGTMESVNAQDTQVTNLNLFGKTFPSCKSANSESGGQMQWTSLKLKGASSNELYLACGTTGESFVCQPTDSRGATYTENCLAGITGKITYTWDYTLCRYLKTDTCSSKKRCLTKIAYCGGNSVAHTCPEESNGITENQLQNCSYYQVSNHLDGFRYSARLPYEVYKNYGMISETGCTPGTECNTCEPGKKYIQTYSARAQGCKSVSAEGDCKTLYLVPYALCGEMADCSEGTVQACSSWKDTTASGPSPFLLGEVLVP